MKKFTINVPAREGTPYPIAFFTACALYTQETVKGRSMPFHQILLILDGKGTLVHNGNTYSLERGCAFFTASYTPVEYFDNGGLTSAFITAKGSALDILAKELSDDGFMFVENANLEKYVSSIDRLINDYRNFCDQGSLSVQAYSIFVDFLSQRKMNVPEWLNETVKYINIHFDEKLTLSDIAKNAYISVSKLCHEFKKYYSMTVFEYIMDVRLQNAHTILCEFPHVTTKDVSIKCGFFDVGYFCKAYRKKYGKTPSEEKRWQHI